MEEALKFQSVFNVNKTQQPTRRIKKRRNFSRFGCRRCKLRKVKCDENKPRCHNCTRIELECTWPFPIDNKIIEMAGNDKLIIGTKNSNKNDIPSLQALSDSVDKPNNTPMLFPYKQYDSWIPGVRMSRNDAFCYYAFVKKFLPSIAHSYLKEKDPIINVLPQLANSSSLIREVYYTCGSYMLGSIDIDFKEFSQTKYNNILRLFNEQLNNEPYPRSEQWLIAQLLYLLCLKHKFGGASGSYETMTHFYNSLKVLSELRDNYNYLSLDELYFYMNGLNNQPYVKGIGEITIDSLIFNYPVVILFCEYQYLGKLVPNPFDKSFIYEISLSNSKKQTDPYNNKTIFRFNILALQTAAKATWLFRTVFLNDKIDIIIVDKLIKCSNNSIECLKELLKSEICLRNQQNILVASLIYTSSIILFKAIICRINFLEIEIENDVNYMVKILDNHVIKGIILPVWCLAVGGLASFTAIKKNFFKTQLLKMKDVLNIVSIENLILYLESIWEISEDTMALSKLLQLSTFNPLYI